MKVKEKIKKLVSATKGVPYANACQIWKGRGEMGQGAYGWWLIPFNENVRWLGANWQEVQEDF